MSPLSLQVEEHDVFQRREWTALRIGWALMALFVVAALVGLLGRGPFSWSSATGREGRLQVEYQHFTHLEADDRVTAVVAAEAVTGDSVDFELAGSWVQSMDISGITPEPEEQVATPYGVRLTFATEPGTELSVGITFRAGEIGRVDGGVLFEGETVPFDQFVYP